MRKSTNVILLGIDLEEFDLPMEYGEVIEREQQIGVSAYGLRIVERLLAMHDIPATFFTTAWWALQCPGKVRRIAEAHEIASHTFFHSSYKPSDLADSRLVLSNISGQPVNGIRMPRMHPVEDVELRAAGYGYNSSNHPTFLPGRYNHLRAPRRIFRRGGMTQLPVSVSPLFRIPVFWLAFRNLPYRIFLRLCRRILAHDGYLVLYFHPWEFSDLSGHSIPWYIRRKSGPAMVDRFERLISDLKLYGEFLTHGEFVNGFEKQLILRGRHDNEN